MTSFESIPTEKELVDPDAPDLGTERLADSEKAFLMAKFEDAARDKARAYEDYLQSPESHSDSTGKEALSFVAWKGLGYSPEDVIDMGRHTSEIMGKNYDIEKKNQKLEEDGNKFGLLSRRNERFPFYSR